MHFLAFSMILLSASCLQPLILRIVERAAGRRAPQRIAEGVEVGIAGSAASEAGR